ncbi:SAM-dependent methyltransferase [Jeotgalicoccus coquinae]|uniref:SAM-dependent methyltransferase n=1 Tax=Jeotgalicoccus coquinae TaxID=709509 RepID=A0A6V7RAU1_9STAP|nr:methyltransferase domain-containing protein [Jeotgalicoccus coquinae]MBB6422818.1 SAM-dependent methyltransferase [Jeotgalicoccus coquinae]CAD2074088.1 tRNA (cmo5U34)-methyltransferase [Jeotgalicoccus coquinae]
MPVILLEASEYKIFAKVYDILNYDMPYNLWLDIINEVKGDARSVLDIGAGTGEILKSLDAKRKLGIDNSEEMVNIARINDTVSEYQMQDMMTMELDETFELITATADVLNYAPSKEAFKAVLKNVYNHLAEGGVFVFDVHTEHKMQNDFNFELYSDSTDDIFYTWQTVPGEEELSVWHELTFFIRNSEDLYKKYEETHYQQTYKHSEILKMANDAGFIIDKSFSDFDITNVITEVAERNFYILKK